MPRPPMSELGRRTGAAEAAVATPVKAGVATEPTARRGMRTAPDLLHRPVGAGAVNTRKDVRDMAITITHLGDNNAKVDD